MNLLGKKTITITGPAFSVSLTPALDGKFTFKCTHLHEKLVGAGSVFKASNGWRVDSHSDPDILTAARTIYLRGIRKEKDDTVCEVATGLLPPILRALFEASAALQPGEWSDRVIVQPVDRIEPDDLLGLLAEKFKVSVPSILADLLTQDRVRIGLPPPSAT